MAWGKITARLLVFLRSSTCVADDWEPRIELRPVERWPSGRRQRFVKPYSVGRHNPMKRHETPYGHWGNERLGRYPYLSGIPLFYPPIPLRYSLRFLILRLS